MSQRYPGYYDGIVAGAPAMRTSYSNLATAYVTTALNGAAPKDAQGKALTDRALSPADRKLVVDGFLKACDALDGTRDGMVFDTRGCRFDPASLVCSGTKNDSCLSPQQAAAIRKGFAGPKTTAGVQVYPGFLYDTGMAATPPPGGFGIPGLLVSGMSPVGPSPTGTDMNVDLAAANALTFQSMAGDSNAWTNLSSFLGHDGKLLFYHGVSDPWFSALDTIGYYERMAADNAPRNVQDYSRLFLVRAWATAAAAARRSTASTWWTPSSTGWRKARPRNRWWPPAARFRSAAGPCVRIRGTRSTRAAAIRVRGKLQLRGGKAGACRAGQSPRSLSDGCSAGRVPSGQ